MTMKKIRITGENAEWQVIRALKLSRAKRNAAGEIFIEGIEGIKQAGAAGLEITRILTAGTAALSLWAREFIAARKGARLLELSPALYRSLSDRNEPSELLVCARPRRSTLEALGCSPFPFLLAFDRPSDFGNLGSAIRSANAFGADGALIIGHGIDIYEPKVIRASLGSVFHTPVAYAESLEALEAFIRHQKERNGLVVLGTDSSGAVPLGERILRRPLLAIIGNEARGMSRALRSLCDEMIRIPIAGEVNSLNAACAASIVMWELAKNSSGEGPRHPAVFPAQTAG
jgi:TrmH family RNA methyltransferase